MNGKKGYVSPPVGNMISCVFKRVGLDQFKPRALTRKLREALAREDFTIEARGGKLFPAAPGLTINGCTRNFTLSESGCEIHTYPEKGTIFFYLYSCRGPCDGRKTYKAFRQAIGNPIVKQFSQRKINVDNDDD